MRWRPRAVLAGVATLTALSGCAPTARPSPVPATMALDPFYTQYLNAGGIPITASAATPPEALVRARSIVAEMLEHRPDLRAALVKLGARVAIMAETEGTMDLPEQRDWKKPTRDDPVLTFCERKLYDQRIGRLTDAQYWNSRARGMGGLMTSGAAENILGKPGTRYFGENIFVHEFSHEIMEGIRTADPALFAKINADYRAAKARGLWKGEYAETTAEEYWAEGTQYWFNSNKVGVIDGQTVLSSDDLKRHDPALFALLSEVYGTRHRLTGDAFYLSPARVPPGGPPASTAEMC